MCRCRPDPGTPWLEVDVFDDAARGTLRRTVAAHRARPALAALAFLGLLLALGGCGDAVVEPRFDPETRAFVVETAAGALAHTVRLSDAAPRPGDTLEIVSVVVNRGEERTVEGRICGLDLAGLELQEYGPVCGGYSARTRLARGDSVRTWDAGVVRAGPGTHRLRLRHLVDPDRWITIRIEVERP